MNRATDLDIRLSGPLRGQVDGVIKNWLLRTPDDNPAMLDMFVDRDKKPYRDLLPWSGEFAGKYLTGATQVLRVESDPALKQRLSRFVDDLIARQDPNGYLGPFPSGHRMTGWAPNVGMQGGFNWDPWGHYHAMLGLLMWYEDTGDTKALESARRMGDLLCETFAGPEKTIVEIRNPEENHAVVHSLALLYQATTEQKYLDLATEIVEEFSAPGAGNYLKGALAGTDFYQLPASGPRWESLHSIMGLAELHWITGKPEYREAFENLWWSIVKTDRHNNGGFSSGEQAQGSPYHRGAIESCCTVAWAAMSVEMLRMTGNPLVADELELSTLNQVVGMHAPDGSWSTYNTPMDGVRIPSTEDISFQIRPGSEELNCCSVNTARGFGMISDWALMQDEEGLVLNWYGPSTISGTVSDTAVTLRQETQYPRDGQIVLNVEPAEPTHFTLKLRIPQWSKQTSVHVNGEPVQAEPGTYLALNRKWQEGDRVELQLDMSPRVWVGEREYQGRASIYRGPILFALQTPGKGPQFTPNWDNHGHARSTRHEGAAVEYRFEGDSVRWLAHRYDDAGLARVLIDGEEVDIVDQYGPGRDLPFTWQRDGLGEGKHTIRIEALGQRGGDGASSNVWINVNGFEPAWEPPMIDPSALEQATVESTEEGRLLVKVKDVEGHELVLQDYGTVGANRTPYVSWLRIRGVQPASFSRENPSRTAHLQH